MNRTYVAADMRLFDKAAARLERLSIEKYNKMVIRKINETVTDSEDYIILIGVISCGGTSETLELLSKIKAKINFLD
jgi:hypothetical protein